MRISIHTLGTRGDVQPYLALALGLQAAGHDVQLAAPSQLEAFVGVRGIRFAHLPGEFLDLMETPDGQAANLGQGRSGSGLRLLNLWSHRTKAAVSRVGGGSSPRSRADHPSPQPLLPDLEGKAPDIPPRHSFQRDDDNQSFQGDEAMRSAPPAFGAERTLAGTPGSNCG